MHGLTIVRSLLVRLVLLAHGLICAWRVVDTNDNQYCWVILVGLGFLLVETGVVIWLRNGREFKTVAFSIIFYLACATPSLWIIHVETANRKLYRLAETKLNSRATTVVPSNHLRSQQQNSISSTTTFAPNSSSTVARLLINPLILPYNLSAERLDCNDKSWYYMDEQRWLDALQESMLLVLALCRLLISREHMTVGKSGIVLIITLINGVDLLAIAHSLQYHDIIIERLWMYIGLAVFSISLFQMSFVDTDGLTSTLSLNKSIKTSKKTFTKRMHFLQNENIYPLFRSLFIQDGLLLLYRIFLATKVHCSKPTIIFFLGKNVLIIALHCYRVYYISKEHEKKKAFLAYKHFLNSSPLIRKYRHPFYQYERDRLSKQQQQRLLHRTLRRPKTKRHRQKTKTPRTFYSSSQDDSISYPFARRRNDGGRARTAFALYGLPFRTPQVPPRPATISSTSSLIAKAFVH